MKSDPIFETLFRDPVYLEFKNHFYNYLRRKDEIAPFLHGETGPVIEIGAGVSPVTPQTGAVVYSDLSEEAMKTLRLMHGTTLTVVLSATEIPLKNNSVSAVVCSEVIEHIEDDEKALREMHRVLTPAGQLILTVPIHDYYFALDDRFVDHKRRYAVPDLLNRLQRAGFKDFSTAKVAGPLEKVTTMAAAAVFRVAARKIGSGSGKPPAMRMFLSYLLRVYKKVSWLYSKVIKLEARILPLSLSSIILVRCRK